MSAQRKLILRDDPHVDWEDDVVGFRLTYAGVLLAETNRDGTIRRARADHKHQIRKVFHLQLRRWWEVSPYLGSSQPPVGPVFGRPYPRDTIDELARRFERFGYNFVPLVTKDLELQCGLDILFLRYGAPGGVVTSVGDIDNRLKTLFDALSMPRHREQVGSHASPSASEVPFFCLLEDDSLMTRVSVETDTLLEPVSATPDPNDVRIVITVRVRPGRVMAMNVGFAS